MNNFIPIGDLVLKAEEILFLYDQQGSKTMTNSIESVQNQEIEKDFPSNYIDKSKWPRGEWDDEPDFQTWFHKGIIPCVIRRHGELGHLCGYIGLLPHHPDNADLQPHGGITWKETTSNGVRWYGFDCAHLGDYSPGLESSFATKERYRNFSYVQSEVVQMAQAVIEAMNSPEEPEPQLGRVQSFSAIKKIKYSAPQVENLEEIEQVEETLKKLKKESVVYIGEITKGWKFLGKYNPELYQTKGEFYSFIRNCDHIRETISNTKLKAEEFIQLVEASLINRSNFKSKIPNADHQDASFLLENNVVLEGIEFLTF